MIKVCNSKPQRNFASCFQLENKGALRLRKLFKLVLCRVLLSFLLGRISLNFSLRLRGLSQTLHLGLLRTLRWSLIMGQFLYLSGYLVHLVIMFRSRQCGLWVMLPVTLLGVEI